MPSPLQQPSTQRKLVYFALILGLYFVNTFFWRGVASPLTGGVAAPWTLTSQAEALELREQSQGDPDLVGSTVSLGLTGSRGLAVTILWKAAIDRQMKHEWNELELLVRLLTKLQPHFLTPWLFQSWNLAYNVSVESDRVKDKYFYISRGIELLAQGERTNHDNPDMRFWLAFYYINKFGVSDEKNTLRSLLQLSAIDPAKRDPKALRSESASGRRRTVDLVKFEQFCRENPQLVRRLRETLRCTTPDDVIDFLAENRKVPCRFVDPESDAGLFQRRSGELKPADEQFPILPAVRSRLFPDEPTASTVVGDSFCNYQFGRVWFAQSMDPLPDPEMMTEIKSRAERLAEPGNKGKKMPRSPAEVIYRGYTARSQSFVAERLEQEGWFDETGWVIDQGQGRSGRGRWFEKDVVVGAGEPLAAAAWKKAYDLWRRHGIESGLYLDPPREEQLKELARRFREQLKVEPNDNAENYRPEMFDKEMAQCLIAYRQLFFREQNKSITNFTHHFTRAFVEQDHDAVQARKLMFEAERLRSKENEPDRAIAAYKDGFALWIKVLSNPQYADFRNDSFILEGTFETELKYVDLLRHRLGPQLVPALVAVDVLRQGASSAAGAAFPGATGLGILYAAVTDQKALPIPILGPMDGDDPSGQPWIPDMVRQDVLTRQLPATASPQPAAPGAAGTPAKKP